MVAETSMPQRGPSVTSGPEAFLGSWGLVDNLSHGDLCPGLSVGARGTSLMALTVLIIALILQWENLLKAPFCRALPFPRHSGGG